MSCCPAHEDREPSLHISLKDEVILLKCHAGCATEDIVKSLGMEMADLFHKADPVHQIPPEKPKIVCTYDYVDESGKQLFQVVRYEPKSFRQRHKMFDGDWDWNMTGVKRVLYHLDQVAIADELYLVEGEKDADALGALGYVATTSPGGANNWRDDYAPSLAGKTLILIPDKDPPGMAYMRQVANSLAGKAKTLSVIILPGEAKDISDWLSAGGKASDLPAMEQSVDILYTSDKPAYRQLEDVIAWDKQAGNLLVSFRAEKLSEERTGIHARVSILAQREMLSWSYLNVERREDRSALATAAHSTIKGDTDYGKEDLRHDLDAFCAGLWDFRMSQFAPAEMMGEETPQPIEFVLRPYLVRHGGTIIYAPPGRGKSYTALLWAVSVDAGCTRFWPVRQVKTLFINLERSGDSLRRRLSAVNRVLGLPATRPLLALNARGRSLTDVLPACKRATTRNNIGLVVLDSISRAGVGDLNENQSGNRVIDALSSLCPTWLALGHTSRVSEDHLYGSVMQDAGADICVQLSSQVADNGILGMGWQITKQNDIGRYAQRSYALEFNDAGLTGFRQARPGEFPEVEGKAKTDMIASLKDFILSLDTADTTATEAANALGFNRVNIANAFKSSGHFVQTRRMKQRVYYGVKV